MRPSVVFFGRLGEVYRGIVEGEVREDGSGFTRWECECDAGMVRRRVVM